MVSCHPSFQELLENAQILCEPEAHIKCSTLKSDVRMFITENKDINEVIAEISHINVDSLIKNRPVEKCANIISNDSRYLLSNNEIVASICARKMNKLCKTGTFSKLSHTSEGNSNFKQGEVELMIDVVKNLVKDGKCNLREFSKCLALGAVIPLEVLYLLHRSNILNYDQYISFNVRNISIIKDFTKSLVYSCVYPSSQVVQNVTTEIISCLVNHSYSADSSKSHANMTCIKKACNIILNTICRKLAEAIVVNSQGSAEIKMYIFEALLWKNLVVSKRYLKEFYSKQLTFLLSHNPNVKVTEAITNQIEWSFARTSPFLSTVYMQLLLVFDEPTEAINVLRSVLETKEINWQMLLSFVSTFLVCNVDAIPLFRDLSTTYIVKGLESSSSESLIAGFLVARQACSEGNHVFPSYSDWFQICFSDEKSLANHKKTFAYLANFLTDLIPHENDKNLKVHLSGQIYVPSGCKDMWQQYTDLAKRHLQRCYSKLDSVEPFSAKRKFQFDENLVDVEDSLLTFEKTNKISTHVLELSIFRRPYFLGKYLPSLLLPRILPAVPDTRMKFINALNKLQKIPTNLLVSYQKECEILRSNLLEDFESMIVDGEHVSIACGYVRKSCYDLPDEYFSHVRTDCVSWFFEQMKDELSRSNKWLKIKNQSKEKETQLN